MIPPNFTPKTLAAHWDCNEKTIRRMCARGDLPFFQVGRDYRIRRIDVETYEAGQCEISESDSSEENAAQSGTTETEPGEPALPAPVVNIREAAADARRNAFKQ